MDTFIKVQKVIAEQLGVDPGIVRPETNIFRDLKADSLDHIELSMALEEEFGIVIDDAEADKLITVQDYVTLIDNA